MESRVTPKCSAICSTETHGSVMMRSRSRRLGGTKSYSIGKAPLYQTILQSPSLKEHAMSSISLTLAQHAILAHALEHADGRIEWFPPNIQGGARQKVLGGLAKRELIRQSRKRWLVAAEDYDALGVPRPNVKKRITNAEGAPPAPN